jgi:hypothetical protein
MQQVGDHQHAVNGHLHADDIVGAVIAIGSEGTGHGYCGSTCLSRFPLSSASTFWYV